MFRRISYYRYVPGNRLLSGKSGRNESHFVTRLGEPEVFYHCRHQLLPWRRWRRLNPTVMPVVVRNSRPSRTVNPFSTVAETNTSVFSWHIQPKKSYSEFFLLVETRQFSKFFIDIFTLPFFGSGLPQSTRDFAASTRHFEHCTFNCNVPREYLFAMLTVWSSLSTFMLVNMSEINIINC